MASHFSIVSSAVAAVGCKRAGTHVKTPIRLFRARRSSGALLPYGAARPSWRSLPRFGWGSLRSFGTLLGGCVSVFVAGRERAHPARSTMASLATAVDAPPCQRVSLALGGHVLRFEPADSSVLFTVRGVHPRFVVEDRTPDCVVTCALGDAKPSDLPPVFEASPVWELRKLPAGDEEVCFYANTREGRVPWTTLVIDRAFRTAKLVQRPLRAGDSTIRVGFPYDEYLMCRMLARAGGLVIHGAAIEYEGMGLLFFGHSGAGKSTISQLAEGLGARVLSDDRSIVTQEGGIATLWGTPWHGSYRKGAPDAAVLRAMYLLVQDRENSIVPIAPPRAAGEIFVRVIHPSVDATEKLAILGYLGELAQQVPTSELRFRPTADAFRLAMDNARDGATRVPP